MNRLAAAPVLLFGMRLSSQAAPATQELRGAFPPDATMEQFTVSSDGRRTYFVDAKGDAWLYDRAEKRRSRIVSGGVSDLTLSAARDALAFTRVSGRQGDAFVWVIRLDATTGLAAGKERRLSSSAGDVPSIAPDGKSIAFARDDASGVGQSVVIVPFAGGKERVVAPTLPASVGNIRWTPDSKRLYIGVNQPVACEPEWSCLPLPGPNRHPSGSIRRVATAGGPVTVVAPARDVFPGLSPDGTTLVYVDTGSVRRWVVADSNGTRRDVITLPPSQSVTSWLTGATILIPSVGSSRALKVQPLAGGSARTLMESAEMSLDPKWSPDGKLVSIVSRGAAQTEIHVLNGDGTRLRSLPLPVNFASGSTWSPDQRWIAFIGVAENAPPHVAVVEVATGRVQRLFDVGVNNPAQNIRWLADSRSLVVSEIQGGTGKDRHVSFRHVDLAGKSVILRDIVLGPTPSAGVLVDAASALIVRAKPAEIHAVRLNGDSAERVVIAERAGVSVSSAPWLSDDGTWFALRRNAPNGQGGQAASVELARTDGAMSSTIPLSFNPAGGHNPRIVPGGKELVVVEAPRLDAEPNVFLVNVGANTTRSLFTYSSRFGPPELAISPDGRSLLALVWQSLPPSILTMDLALRRNGNAK